MDPRIDERYLAWLYSKVELPGMPPFWKLLDQLFKTPFLWSVPNDDNRASDGLDLRTKFMFHHRMHELPEDWASLDCSMLEMLIALSERMSFNIDIDMPECFWHILGNLGLGDSTDDDPIDSETIEDILDRVNGRAYDYNGSGGLFPIQEPLRDQREVEILYQMYRYIQERNY